MASANKTLGSYFFYFLLLSSMILGGITGYFFDHSAYYLRPFGEIFLNLIFTAIVPMIFFSVTAAIARMKTLGKLSHIAFYMVLVFLVTGIIAAIYTLFIVCIFPPAQGISIALTSAEPVSNINFIEQIPGIFTAPELSHLFSQKHILALIVFSILVGLATAQASEKSNVFIDFLHAGEDIFMRVFNLVMYYAPIGFFAYFAVLVHDLGPQLLVSYFRVTILYYSFGILYFILTFSVFAYYADPSQGIKLFWRAVFLPAVTALATCSSAASIPANLTAAKKMRVAPEIYETVIPLGALIHKDGSVMGGVFKIAFLFGIFHLDFSGVSVLLTALGVSLLVGTVMGAIPSGGMLGELLILSVYGFPPSVLIIIAALSIVIDPLATLLNVTCNSVSTMMIARLVEGKKWLKPEKIK